MAGPDNPQYKDRVTKLEKWRAAGVDGYGSRVDGLMRIEAARAVHKGPEVTPHDGADVVKVAGRIVLLRGSGKLIFLTLQDWTGRVQVGLSKQSFDETTWAQTKLLELGDIAWFEGKIGHSNTKEVTIWGTGFGLLSKALLPPPDKFHGLSDTELRYRQRYVDLFANPDSMDVFLFRSKMIDSIRAFLKGRDFVEVETPMMQAIAGGAAARPFVTHHNALGIDLFMRISPELYLKRLLVGGVERVFEINRNFRNEGIDTTHNPEFTMMEVYQAYSDLAGMMELTESLVVRLVKERIAENAKLKTQNAKPGEEAAAALDDGRLRLQFGERIIDYTPPFERVSYASLFREYVGVEMTDAAGVRRVALERGVAGIDVKEHDVVVGELFEQLAEGKLESHDRPVFLYDYPAALCPLTRRKPSDPTIAERFELFVAGMELANAYTELNDPAIQEETFSRQLAGLKEEDSMAKMDDDFINALRYGMPPAGGLGVGIDRLAMLLTNRESIRDVVLFPLLKPQATEITEEQMLRDTIKIENGLAPLKNIADIRPIVFVLEKDGSLRIFEV